MMQENLYARYRYAVLLLVIGLLGNFAIVSPAQAKKGGGSCTDNPGDNRQNPATVGPHKGKFAGSSSKTEQVKSQLLQGPLAKIAQACGTDLEFNSGFRDCANNGAVGGVSKSQHKEANAVDIRFCKGKSCEQMVQILQSAGCTGIGKYGTFVQCDIGPQRSWGECGGGKGGKGKFSSRSK